MRGQASAADLPRRLEYQARPDRRDAQPFIVPAKAPSTTNSPGKTNFPEDLWGNGGRDARRDSRVCTTAEVFVRAAGIALDENAYRARPTITKRTADIMVNRWSKTVDCG